MKKNCCETIRWHGRKKLFLMARITVFFMLAGLLQVSASVYSQQTELVLKLEKTSIEQVLKNIEGQSQFYFLYRSDLLNDLPPVSLDLKNVKLEDVLNKILVPNGFTYEVEDRVVVIKKAAEKPNTLNVEQKGITGNVKDKEGNSIPGVSVLIKGTNIGIITDNNGNFQLDIPASAKSLIFSFVGMKSQEVEIGNNKNLTIVMIEETFGIDEVVAVGYGTQKKVNLTGAVSTVAGSSLLQSSTGNVSNALTGRSSGIITVSNSGEPGNDASTILIRGMNSFGKGTSPLIVVDGIADRDMNRLNPADIESISVLKDASAAIYGVRSANGVILVTTKRGSGKNKVVYDYNYGLQQYTRMRPNITNSLQYMTYQNETDLSEGRPVSYTPALLTQFNTLNHNWVNDTYRKSAPQMQHRLSFSGGTDRISYYVSGQYFDQESNYKVSDKAYKQFNLVSNIDAKVSNNIKLSLDLNARREDNNNPTTNTYVTMVNASVMPPWVPVRWDNGQYATVGLNSNPVASTSRSPGYNNTTNYLLNSKMGIDIQLPFITKGLSFNSYYSYDASQFNSSFWTQPYSLFTNNNNVLNDVSGQTGITSFNRENKLNIRKTLFAKIAYDQKFGDHNVNAFAAYEESTTQGDRMYIHREGFLSSNLQQLFAGGTNQMLGTGEGSQDGRKSYFGRLAYDYKSKYLAEVSVRYNGSFNFAPNKRWGTFPAVSLGWRISDENFFKNNISAINNLKLRASWAIMGSDAIDPYQYLQRYIVTPTNWYGNFLYTGTGNNQNPQIYASVTPNPDVTWEKQDSKNIGLDISLLSNRLSATVELFKNTRKDILTKPLASIPIYTGLDLPATNIGESENKGLDLSVNYSEKRTVVKYYVGVNFTYTQNKIIFKDESALIPDYQKATGFAIDSYMIYETNGIYRTQADVDNSPHLAGAAPGDMWIIDKSGDKNIDGNDMVRIPYSPTPKIAFGIPMGIEWKKFTIDIIWAGQAKAKILYQPMNGISIANPPQWLFDGRWTPTTPNAPYPRAFSGLSNRNNLPTDLFLIDGTFLRLKSVEIAYKLPEHLFAKIGVTDVKVHISGFNLFSIDKMKKYGRDVENTSISGSWGAENNSAFNYPQTKIYEIGLRVGF